MTDMRDEKTVFMKEAGLISSILLLGMEGMGNQAMHSNTGVFLLRFSY